jgi:hypothetical protein
MADSVLNSWKDIATHLHTSVRTAQRWELHFGLPIHRPSGTHKGPVLAFEAELDRWVGHGGAKEQPANGNSRPFQVHQQRWTENGSKVLSAQQRVERMHALISEVKTRTERLRQQLEKALAIQPKVSWNGAAKRSTAVGNVTS